MQEKDGIMVRIKDIINGATDAERDQARRVCRERLIRQTTCFQFFLLLFGLGFWVVMIFENVLIGENADMEFEIGSVIKMKKPHPCGENRWEILRVGMDFRLKCQGCGHQVMVPRKVVEKNFKGFL